MEKQKILEIENQAKLKNISVSKYRREIGINPQSYYQAKSLLKFKIEIKFTRFRTKNL